MKETIRQEIWNDMAGRKFAACFVNPGLPEALQALQLQLSGKPVLAVYETDLVRTDRWETFYTFPLAYGQLPRCLAKRKLLNKLRQPAPHLFRPVKTLYAGSGLPGAWLVQATDALWKNQYHQKTRKVKLKNELDSLPWKVTEAWLFEELQVNVTRLTTELLKAVFASGGTVLNYLSVEEKNGQLLLHDPLSGNRLRCEASLFQKQKISDRPAMLLNFLPWENFSLVYSEKNCRWLLNGISSPIAVTATCRSGKNNFAETARDRFAAFSPEITTLPGNDQLPARLPSLRPDYRLPCSFEGVTAEKVPEMLEQQFDVAKQTGIRYHDFKTFFHRYGRAIEPITERAYELLAESRNPMLIWEKAGSEYRLKYEWDIPQNENEAIFRQF